MAEPVRRLEFLAPLPPRGCAQNFRGHWSARAKAAQSYRATLRYLTLEALGKERPKVGSVRLACTFVTDGKRSKAGLPEHMRPYCPQDVTNAVGAFKAGEDGIADALGVDDRAANWSHAQMSVWSGKPGPPGLPGVHVTVEWSEGK